VDEIRVVIADDHPLVRQGLRKVLELEPRIRVLDEAGDGQGAINIARRLQPDVVLMDLNMPGINGIEASRVIKRETPGVKIIALTVYDDQDVSQVIRAGVSGYVLKDVEPQELINAIVGVCEGKSVIHPMIASRLIGEFNRLSEAIAHPTGIEKLTAREREVLQLIARGNSNREIAMALFISEKTVKNHITSIFRKLNIEDRTQAAILAIKHKLVDLD